MPRSPIRTSTGSPGTRWIRIKARKTIPRKVGMTRLRRVNRNRSIDPAASETYYHAKVKAGGKPPAFYQPISAGLVDALENMGYEGVDLVADHLLAHRHIDGRMSDREPGGFLMEDHLGLLVEGGALLDVADLRRLVDQVGELLVAPLGDVLSAGPGRPAGEQHAHEVVRIAIVAGPAEEAHLVLTRLQALAVLAPFEGLELGGDADLRQIGLDHLGDLLGVRIVGTLHRHVPEVGLEIGHPRGLERSEEHTSELQSR